MKDLNEATGHTDTKTTKNIYTAVVDNIPQKELERPQPQNIVDNISAMEMKEVKING